MRLTVQHVLSQFDVELAIEIAEAQRIADENSAHASECFGEDISASFARWRYNRINAANAAIAETCAQWGFSYS